MTVHSPSSRQKMTSKLLLVDDEEGIRTVLGISLADRGYSVLTAADGQEAFNVFRREAPPIVLTDIKMPGMDGIELLQRIKAECPDTEVIMITGHGDLDLAIKSIQLEATDFVTKPIHDAVLDIALGRAQERIALRQQLREHTENLERLVREKSARIVELERLAAIDQAMEGLAQAMRGIASDMGDALRYFNEMPCFVSIHDKNLIVVAANDLYRTRLGKGVGDFSWMVYIHTDTDPESCPVGKTFQAGAGQRERTEMLLADGATTPVIVHTAPIRNREGMLELVLEIAVDISEVKRLQDELDTTQQRYRQLFEEAPCYITVQDRSLSIVAANRRFQSDFGEPGEQRCFYAYKRRSEPCPNCPVQETFLDGKPHQSEMVVTSRNGDQLILLVGTAPIVNASGDIHQVMELATNVTQIRNLEDHLSKLGLLLSTVSHGVKGMLTALDGGIYRIRSGLRREDTTLVQEGLSDVEDVSSRIRNTVLDILFYAKEREIEPELVDVMNVLYDAVQLIEPKMAKHPLQRRWEFDPTVGTAWMDRSAIRTALVAILENAVEACLEDSTKPEHRIRFFATRKGNELVFEIEDDGIGMDPETVERIFSLFFSSKGKRGTGLGLFIAKKIIQQHRGRIEVHSEKGVGTTFRLILPANKAQA